MILRCSLQVKKNALFFTYAIEDQAGEYVCRAENVKGVAFKSVKISVVSNPAWQKKIKNVTLDAGDPLSLSGSFYGGRMELKMTWYLNNAFLISKRVPDTGKVSLGYSI